MGPYLAYGDSQRQDSQFDTYGVILECEDEESTKEKDAPDDDVGQDSSGKRVGINHGSSIPKYGHVVPSQRRRDNRDVDESRGGRVAEVEEGEIEQVDDEEKLSLPEKSSDPEHDEAETEEVMQDEMASHIGGTGDEMLVCAPEVTDIVGL